MIREINTPNHSLGFFRELVDRTSPRWLENSPIKRGVLYSSLKGSDPEISRAFPELFFLRETVPIGSNTVAGMTQHNFVTWSWSTDANAESSFNAEISYLGDATANPVFARKYTIRRDTYDSSPFIATATPLTVLLGAKVVKFGSGYTTANCTLLGPGTGGKIVPVIADGQVISYIVEQEGEGYDSTSSIQVIGDGTGAEAQLLIQPVTAILTSQKKIEIPDSDPYSNEFVAVLRVWEVLPGPFLPETRYDDDLGPVQMRRRAVLNTGQLGGQISASGKTNYEARDGSSVVSWEIQEVWTDGSASNANNPAFPVLRWATYADERGNVNRTSQIQVRDPLQTADTATITRPLPGIVVKTWFEAYQDNPYLTRKVVETWREVVHADQRVSSEFGGGVLAISETTAEPGSTNVAGGLLVQSDELRTHSPDEQTRRREVLSDGSAWPVLLGVHTDEVTGIVVNYTKQVVAAGTGYPGRSGYRGPFVEIQPYDKWKSIQIVSAIDPNTLPGPESWPTVHSIFLPPILLEIEGIWTDAQSRLTEALADSATAQVARTANGSAIIKARAGYRGNVPAIHTRMYSLGPFALAAIPTPLKILPSTGSIIFTGLHNETGYTNQDDGGQRFHDSMQMSVHAVDVSGYLVGNFGIENADHNMLCPAASATSGGGSIAAIATFPLQSHMVVNIPQSTPTPVALRAALLSAPGTVWDVQTTEGRFGVWVLDIISVHLFDIGAVV